MRTNSSGAGLTCAAFKCSLPSLVNSGSRVRYTGAGRVSGVCNIHDGPLQLAAWDSLRASNTNTCAISVQKKVHRLAYASRLPATQPLPLFALSFVLYQTYFFTRNMVDLVPPSAEIGLSSLASTLSKRKVQPGARLAACTSFPSPH